MSISSYLLESHDSTSGKRVIWNRTGTCPTRGANVKHARIFRWCQKWPYHVIWVVMDRKGEGRVLAAAPGIGLFFPSLSSSQGGPIFCHEDSPSPPGHTQTFVSWVVQSTMSQISSDVLWFISVAISGYRTWMRKDLETSTKQNLGGTCSTRRKPASYCLRVKVLPSRT